jgi:hypothetical protein
MASKNEKRAAELGISLKEYKNSSEYKMKKAQEEIDYYNSEDYLKNLMKSIFDTTPAEREVLPTFEEQDTPELQAQDRQTAEAMMIPYYEQQIEMAMEDLNDYVANQNVNYQRTLRRARASAAKAGGAIGTEIENTEAEIKEDRDMIVNEKTKQAERKVGTEKIQQSGYQSSGLFSEGSLIGEMKSAIEEETMNLTSERAAMYNADAAKYYNQDSQYSYNNKKLF